MSNKTRQDILQALIDRRIAPEQALTALGAFGWDSDQEVAVVRHNHVRRVLEEYLAGGISASDVEEWANALEGRDDLSFAPSEVGLVIFQLANPALEGALSPERARDIISDMP